MNSLTEEELAERRYAVDFARANNELSGYYITDKKYLALQEQYARGEIELDVIGAYVDGMKAKEDTTSEVLIF